MLKRWLLVSSLSVDGVNSCVIAKWENVKCNCWQFTCVGHISASFASFSNTNPKPDPADDANPQPNNPNPILFCGILCLSLSLFFFLLKDLAATSIPLSPPSSLICLTLLRLSLSVSTPVCSSPSYLLPTICLFTLPSISYSLDAPPSTSGSLWASPPAHYRQPQPSTTMSW